MLTIDDGTILIFGARGQRFYEDGLSTGWAQALFAVMDAREIGYPDEVVEQIFRSDLDELDAWACRVAVARTALDLC